jgi:hypothetical protein
MKSSKITFYKNTQNYDFIKNSRHLYEPAVIYLIGGGKFLYHLRRDKISTSIYQKISIYTQFYCGKPQFLLRRHTDFYAL